MFEGLRKPKFPKKCKLYIKPIKTRLDTILKKKKAVHKYLKNDVAELLENNLDINAYGRAEGLILEQNMTSCYEQIGRFCSCILEHLQKLQTQKECPDECMEAVYSLIYAAARFADLPELRSLRTLFTKKFGDSGDTFVNKEFAQKLSSRAFTKETKLQLLRDIAQEHSLNWDSRPLEKRLDGLPSLEEEKQKSNEELEKSSEDRRNPKREDLGDRDRQGMWEKSFASNRDEIAETGFEVQGSSEDDSSSDMSSEDGEKAGSSSVASVSEDEVENSKKPFYYRFIPPPYLKQKPAVEETHSPKPSASSPRIRTDRGLKDSCGSPVAREKPKPISTRSRHLKPPPGHEDKARSPKVENVKEKKTQTPRKEERGSLNSPRESGKSISNAKAHQQQDAYNHSDENSRRRRPNLNVHMPLAERKSNEDMPIVASPKHPKLPEYDEFAARLAALRRNC